VLQKVIVIIAPVKEIKTNTNARRGDTFRRDFCSADIFIKGVTSYEVLTESIMPENVFKMALLFH
jgi:hypothetical protein